MREPDQDDEVLGKAYDARLMGRLWGLTRPHLRLVLCDCALFPAVALLELSQPYLIKIAIDDYILRRDWAGLGGMAALFLVVLVALYALRATPGLSHPAHRPARHARPARGAVRASPAARTRGSSTGARSGG